MGQLVSFFDELFGINPTNSPTNSPTIISYPPLTIIPSINPLIPSINPLNPLIQQTQQPLNLSTYSDYMAMMAQPTRYLVSEASWSNIMTDALNKNIISSAISYQSYQQFYNIYNLSQQTPTGPLITTYAAFINQTSPRQLTCSEWSAVCKDISLMITYDTYIQKSYNL